MTSVTGWCYISFDKFLETTEGIAGSYLSCQSLFDFSPFFLFCLIISFCKEYKREMTFHMRRLVFSKVPGNKKWKHRNISSWFLVMCFVSSVHLFGSLSEYLVTSVVTMSWCQYQLFLKSAPVRFNNSSHTNSPAIYTLEGKSKYFIVNHNFFLLHIAGATHCCYMLKRFIAAAPGKVCAFLYNLILRWHL